MEQKQKDFIKDYLSYHADRLIQAKELIEEVGTKWPSNKAYLEGAKEDIKNMMIDFIKNL